MRLRTLLKQQFRRMGLEVSRFNSPGSLTAQRQMLFSKYEVDLVLDVGASDGGFALELRAAGYAGGIVSFEPLDAPFNSLQAKARNDDAWEVIQTALGTRRAELEMFVAQDDKCSSLLEPLERHTKAYAGATAATRTTVAVNSLDAVFPSLFSCGMAPFLKIDTQGYEQHVLEGGQQALPSIVGLQVELSLVPLYEGNPQYYELMQYIEHCGFHMMAVAPVFTDPDTGQTLQIDALFFRPLPSS